MKEIPLTKGYVALVDDDLYEKIISFGKWSFHQNGYAIIQKSYKKPDGKWGVSVLRMHRLVLNANDGEFVDHINGNKLDNRRSNIRICNGAENRRNVGLRKNNISGYKGVYFAKPKGFFTAQITFENKKIHLGCFTCPIEAARAYNEAAKKYHGEFARLNDV